MAALTTTTRRAALPAAQSLLQATEKTQLKSQLECCVAQVIILTLVRVTFAKFVPKIVTALTLRLKSPAEANGTALEEQLRRTARVPPGLTATHTPCATMGTT